MPLNSDKPGQWADDVTLSVRLFDQWFLFRAPQTFREERRGAVDSVQRAFAATADFTNLTPEMIEANPRVVEVLRMATTPPLARDRLIGLAQVGKSLVESLERGRLPRGAALAERLKRICAVIEPLLDLEVFPWRVGGRQPTESERDLAAFVVADRLCRSLSDPIVRNAHQVRQREILRKLLTSARYKEKPLDPARPISLMAAGTFAFGVNVLSNAAMIAVDLVVQPKKLTGNRIPIIVELKAAGDYTNVNKRRKEESDKFRNLKAKYGEDLKLILFLCGYFDRNYLQYEAAAGIDWVWEHRPDDLLALIA